MTGHIRLGIVGATLTQGGSGWGQNAHIPAIHALPDFELKAVCTAHEETALAAKEAFGAELAFHDIDAMASHPEVDVVAVSVRVPLHRDLVMAALRAGKAVFCEWPLGANLAEAEEMADYARQHGLRTQVGLQARSDATMQHARDLVRDGHIGDVIAANLSVVTASVVDRPRTRVWQAERTAGVNPMTIQGGHAIDAMCFVAGEVAEVAARVTTQTTRWRNVDDGVDVAVDAPDTVSVAGMFEHGGEVSIQIATVPHSSGGFRLEVYGTNGFLTLSAASPNIGPARLFGARGGETPAEMQAPDSYTIVPEGTPSGQPRNVAQAYVALADAFQAGRPFEPDFDLAVRRHRLLDAIERSSAEGRAVTV